MRLDDLPESGNIEDRRGEGGGFGGFGGMPIGRGGLGIGGIVVLGLIGWALGIDPRLLIGGAEVISGGDRQVQAPARNGPKGVPQDAMGRDISRILGSTEVVWKDIFAKDGMNYRPPTLVMYSGVTRASCGTAQSAMGPFYCPVDQKVYLDTSFFREIQTRFRGCDAGSKSCLFAEAYVIAHEVGHHVQNLLGILPKVEQQQAAQSKASANALQVKVELQADCFAGIWANRSEQRWNELDPGDVEAALRTAAAIGDDTLQKQAQGYAVPDSFTHGTSAQRQRWFNSGFKGGTIGNCNTFGAAQL
jgi:predicted metalloprotease